MRLLIATGLFPPDIGGPSTNAKLLATELPKHGITVFVESFGRVLHLPRVIRHIVYFFRLFRASTSVDLVYALDPVSTGAPAYLAAKLLKKPFVVRITGDYAWEQYVNRTKSGEHTTSVDKFQRNKYDLRTELRRKMQRYIALSANKVIVPCNYLNKIVVRWGIPEHAVTTIHNGFNSAEDYGMKETLRGLLRFEGKMIISVGRLIPLKGFIELIEAMPEIIQKFDDVKLVIVGDGPDQHRIEKTIKRLNLEDRVVLTGALSRDILFRYIKAADVFVLNSIHETFSHLLLETMSVGTPIVTTAVGGTPEIIEHDIEGILVTPHDQEELIKAITTLFTNKTKASHLVQRAKKKVLVFSEQRMVTQLVKQFANLTSSSPRR